MLLEAKRVANMKYQQTREDLKQKNIGLEIAQANLKTAEQALKNLSFMVISCN
jgi:hypothetical protein